MAVWPPKLELDISVSGNVGVDSKSGILDHDEIKETVC